MHVMFSNTFYADERNNMIFIREKNSCHTVGGFIFVDHLCVILLLGLNVI